MKGHEEVAGEDQAADDVVDVAAQPAEIGGLAAAVGDLVEGLLIGSLLFFAGDLLAGGDYSQGLALLVADDIGGQADMEDGAVATDVEAVAGEAFERTHLLGGHGAPAAAGNKDADILVHQLFDRVAVHLSLGRVGIEDAALEVGNGHPQRQVVNHLLQGRELKAQLAVLRLRHLGFGQSDP